MNFKALQEKIQSASIVDKFIYINLVVFVITLSVSSFNHLQSSTTNSMLSYFAYDANGSLFNAYTFITYGFVHKDFIHILFNVIALYYIGHLFLNFFSESDFIWYYIIGSVFGAIAFYFSYHYFPIFKKSSSLLIGASAGVSAILVGLATATPNYEIKFRLIGYVKLWIVAAAFVFLSIAMIRNGNEGGQITHLGGALIGFIMSKFIFNKNKKTKLKISKRSQSNLKTVYNARNKSEDFGLSNHQKELINQRKIDALLDKISKSGYESLSQKERDFLASASKK